MNFFALFSTDWNSTSNFAFYGTHIKFFQRKCPFCQQKWNFFTLITLSKSFRPIQYLGEFFCTFFSGFKLDIKFCVLWYHIKFFQRKGPFCQQKWNFFTLITVSKSLRPLRFLGELFCTFFNCFEFGIKFCLLWYPHRIFSKSSI